MAKEPTCLVCQKVMEPGFLTDFTSAAPINVTQPRWCAGEPQSSFIPGTAKASQLAQGLKVIAYRCPQCEALRLYAPSTE